MNILSALADCMWAVRVRLVHACVRRRVHIFAVIHSYVVICLPIWCSTVKGVGAPIHRVFYSYLLDIHLLRVIWLSLKLTSATYTLRHTRHLKTSSSSYANCGLFAAVAYLCTKAHNVREQVQV